MCLDVGYYILQNRQVKETLISGLGIEMRGKGKNEAGGKKSIEMLMTRSFTLSSLPLFLLIALFEYLVQMGDNITENEKYFSTDAPNCLLMQ